VVEVVVLEINHRLVVEVVQEVIVHQALALAHYKEQHKV